MHVEQETIASENCTNGAIVSPVTAYAHACGAGNLNFPLIKLFGRKYIFQIVYADEKKMMVLKRKMGRIKMRTKSHGTPY